MRAVVTGGAGFIGSHVVERLLGDGHAVSVIDDLSTGRREHVPSAARLHVVDIRDPALGEIFATERPEVVVHTAAQVAVARSVADPLFDAGVNVLGTINVLEAARRAGAVHVVYTSTGGAAYGNTDVLPTSEDHPTRATSPYGVSKVAAERYLECWASLTGGHALSLRLANVYGPRQSPGGEAGVVAIFCRRLLRGETCVINGDGTQTRDFVFVEDVADAVTRAIATPAATGAVNIGTGRETSVNDLYRRLATALGVGQRAEHGPTKHGEARRSALDASRAAQWLGWTPSTGLDEGLRRTLSHFARVAGNDAGAAADGHLRSPQAPSASTVRVRAPWRTP